MRKTFRAAFLLTAAMGAVLYGQEKTPPAAPLQNKTKQAQLIARLEQRIPELMKDGNVPGLSIALVRNGELAWQRGFGIKSAKTKEPVNDDTVFEAASLSKPVFAYAVLKLVDAGKFDLDKPLNQYLPGNYDVGDDPQLNGITARRVLSHTTGFPNWRNGSLKIYLAPGTRFSYSGEGFVYLSRVQALQPHSRMLNSQVTETGYPDRSYSRSVNQYIPLLCSCMARGSRPETWHGQNDLRKMGSRRWSMISEEQGSLAEVMKASRVLAKRIWLSWRTTQWLP